jgi:hypothetical protein
MQHKIANILSIKSKNIHILSKRTEFNVNTEHLCLEEEKLDCKYLAKVSHGKLNEFIVPYIVCICSNYGFLLSVEETS